MLLRNTDAVSSNDTDMGIPCVTDARCCYACTAAQTITRTIDVVIWCLNLVADTCVSICFVCFVCSVQEILLPYSFQMVFGFFLFFKFEISPARVSEIHLKKQKALVGVSDEIGEDK